VQTSRDSLDGRSRRVALTDAGRAKLAESRRLWKEAQRRFESAYGAERAAALRRSLGEIVSEEFALAFSRG
jgi:DNA-binding MarR family transcriptional regulator